MSYIFLCCRQLPPSIDTLNTRGVTSALPAFFYEGGGSFLEGYEEFDF